jgi:hypothetical protein
MTTPRRTFLAGAAGVVLSIAATSTAMAAPRRDWEPTRAWRNSDAWGPHKNR